MRGGTEEIVSLLKLKDIGKIYVSDNSVAVGIRGVNLEFDAGEFVAVTGKSGCGKTTLLNVMSGMDTYEEGELYIEGEPTSHYSQSDWEIYRQEYISFIFQEYNIIDSFTVLQNVELALSDVSSKKERRERALALIERVGLTKFKNHKGSKLSGGQKQRTVIARALAKDSPIILADEPTGNLDSQTSREIVELLAEISREKLVVVVTHSFSELEEFATREVRIFDGSIERDEQLRPTENIKKVKKCSAADNRGMADMLKKGMELGRHRFSATPKLSVFMCILMVIAMIGTFLITALCITDLDAFDKNYMFNHIDGRAIIVRQDGKVMSETELKKLAKETGAESYMRYDALLDSELALGYYDYELGKYYHQILEYSYDNSVTPDIGRLPKASDETLLVLPIEFQPLYGKDTITKDTVELFDGSYILRVVGVKYYLDNTVDAGKVVLTKEGFEKISAIDFLCNNYNKNREAYIKMDIDNYGATQFYQVIVDSELKGKSYYFCGYFYDEMKGYWYEIADLQPRFRYVIYDYSTNGMGKETVYSEKDAIFEYEKCASVYEHGNENYSHDCFVISPDLAEALAGGINKDDYKQASLFFGSDAEAESKVALMRDKGYVAVPSNATYTSEELAIMSILQAIMMIAVWVLMILFLGMFLSLCSVRAIVSKQGDLAILRSMGIKNDVIRVSMYTQTFISMIPSLVLLVIAAFFIYTSPILNPIFPYMHAFQYAMIIIGMVMLNIFVTKRYNKKMFSDSVRKTLKGGNGQ